MIEVLNQVFVGVVGGFCYSLSGLANAKARESFDWKKMAPTIIVAAIVGGVAGFTGQDYGIVVNGSMAAGITVIVEKTWKALWAYLNKK